MEPLGNSVTLVLDSALIGAGLLLLIWGAEAFVSGASSAARSFGVSPLLVGLTVVSVGTSSPELLVNLTAQLRGLPAMAMGNAVGSNIVNIALVLGLAAVIRPVSVHSRLLRREYPMLLAATLLLGLMLLDGWLGPLEGGVLVLGLAAYLAWTARTASAPEDPLLAEGAAEAPGTIQRSWAVLWLVLGLAGLIGGSRLLVGGGSGLAEQIGLSELVIGLTVVALGTSLPELATSLAAAVKGEADLAVGNVVGSCLFNILGVLGLPALFGGLPADGDLLGRDLPVLVGLTLVIGPFFLNGPRGVYRVNRIEGGLLVATYLGYLAWTLDAFPG